MKLSRQVLVLATAVAASLPVVLSTRVASSGVHHHRHHHHQHNGQVRGSTLSQPKVEEKSAISLPSTSEPLVQSSPAHQEILHEVEHIEQKISQLHDVRDAMQFAGKLADMEIELAHNGEGALGVQLMERISKVRADLCVNHHLATSETEDCETFMHRACQQGTQAQDTVPAPQVAAAQCTQFFLHAKKIGGSAGQPPSPSAAPYAAPAASPVDDTDARGITAEEKAEAVRIWTQAGKRAGPTPSQGFAGEKVHHKYMHTMTDDWQTEFGPAARHKTFEEVCADHPNNEWCRLHGYYKEETPQLEAGYDYSARGHASSNFSRWGSIVAIAFAPWIAVAFVSEN